MNSTRRGIISSSESGGGLIPDPGSISYFPLYPNRLDQNGVHTLIESGATYDTSSRSTQLTNGYLQTQNQVTITNEFSIQMCVDNRSGMTNSWHFFCTKDNVDGVQVYIRTSYGYPVLLLYHDGGTLKFFNCVSTVFKDPGMHTMTVRTRSGNTQLWIDGVLDKQDTWAYTSLASSVLTIGAKYNLDSRMDGYYKHIKVYDRYITDQEISDYQVLKTT